MSLNYNISQFKIPTVKASLFHIAATLVCSTLTVAPPLSANELSVHSWNYSSPERLTVQQGNMLVHCEANPSRCPSGLSRSRGTGYNSGSASLYDPSASSTANHTSVIITGDRNSLSLTTEQSSENDSINADQSGSATIDYGEVLNIDM